MPDDGLIEEVFPDARVAIRLGRRIWFCLTVPSAFLRAYFGYRRHYAPTRRETAGLSWRDAIGAEPEGETTWFTISNHPPGAHKCSACGTPLETVIDMGRVHAGVGGPRPTYTCPNQARHINAGRKWETNTDGD